MIYSVAEIEQFVSGIIENLIVALPQFFVVVTTVIYSLNGIKKKVSAFPDMNLSFKNEITENVKSQFLDTKEQIGDILKIANKEIVSIVTRTKKEITEEVHETLTTMGQSLGGMQQELSGFLSELVSTKEQVNMLVIENKALLDMVCTLVSKDPLFTKNNISKKVRETYRNLQSNIKTSDVILDAKKMERILSDSVSVIGAEETKSILERAIKNGKEEKPSLEKPSI
jgi:regulator of replication initiation timing